MFQLLSRSLLRRGCGSLHSTFLLILITAFGGQAVFSNDIDVRLAGATGDGKTMETVTIQKAIDSCSEQGGGKVTFPPGRYLTGTFFLKDNVTLRLEEGATILGSTHIADYQPVELFTEGTGQKMGWCLIGALDAQNIGIEGPGVIDGQGKKLNDARSAEKGKRPILLRFVRCTGVSLSRLRLQYSAVWMAHLAQCRVVKIDGVSITNHGAGNNDGFDIDSCDGVFITNCDVDSGDDALCFKSTRPTPSRNIVVSNCRLKSDCAGIKFGTETLGGFEDVSITKCHIAQSGYGGINIFSVDGGTVRNISLSDITMDKVNMAICIRLGARLRTFHEGDEKKTVGSIQKIHIQNVRADNVVLAGVLISGIPGHRVDGVSLENIHIKVQGGGKAEDVSVVLPEREAAYPESVMFGRTLPAYGVLTRHVKGLQIANLTIETLKPDARPLRWIEDVDNLQWTP